MLLLHWALIAGLIKFEPWQNSHFFKFRFCIHSSHLRGMSSQIPLDCQNTKFVLIYFLSFIHNVLFIHACLSFATLNNIQNMLFIHACLHFVTLHKASGSPTFSFIYKGQLMKSKFTRLTLVIDCYNNCKFLTLFGLCIRV